MTKTGPCPICLTTANQSLSSPTFGLIECPVCGLFAYGGPDLIAAPAKPKDPRLSAWIREHKENGSQPPELVPEKLNKILEGLPTHKLLDKALLLLRAIERRTKYPGQKVILQYKTDYPLAWASNADEFEYILNSLVERGLVEFLSETAGAKKLGFPIDVGGVIIKPAGWEYLDRKGSAPAIEHQAFVAMSFSTRMDAAFAEGIKPAVTEAGYTCVRVDKVPHIERIDTKIMNDIRDSRFVIADVTEHKHGVYFEAGFALGLGRPVIWCVNRSDLDGAHFDTRQYNHIVWDSPTDLKDQLYQAILFNVGKLR